MYTYYLINMTAKKLKFKKYRKWHQETFYRSPERPIKYKDGSVGGAFQSHVEISSGDLNRNTDKPPTREVFAVEAVMHYKKGKDRTFAKVYSSLAEAMLVYQRLRDEIKANLPFFSYEAWGVGVPHGFLSAMADTTEQELVNAWRNRK